MKTEKALQQKTAKELQEELIALRREQFNLRVQRALQESPRSHHFKKTRRDIARIRTLLTARAKHEGHV